MGAVPSVRVTAVNDAPVDPAGAFVLYWMIAARRARSSFALDRAVQRCRELGLPLVVLEPLRCGYRWASDRLHAFVIDGMRDNAAAFARSPAVYHPYIEPRPGDGSGLVAAMAEAAAVVVTDDYPCFFLPRMVAAAGRALRVRLEAVDGNGVYPMRATDRVFTTAASFRRHLQKNVLEHLLARPSPTPLRDLDAGAATLPAGVARRWPPADLSRDTAALVAGAAVDRGVSIAGITGGSRAGERLVASFLNERLALYPTERNQPEVDAQSHLSPYLHFGHVSAHEVALRVLDGAGWSPERVAERPNGSRSGWWGAGEAAEAFVDELVTWREIGFNRCALTDDYADYDSLPAWALATLADHAGDEREHVYDLATLEAAHTGDELWNAAQRQLVREGTIHNYLRMLWGKKILEWSPHPRDAVDAMIELNNKYAVDGRDPNSYSGIFWVLGRYDRAWGPERPIFGKVRYMSSASTARKLRVGRYLERYAR